MLRGGLGVNLGALYWLYTEPDVEQSGNEAPMERVKAKEPLANRIKGALLVLGRRPV